MAPHALLQAFALQKLQWLKLTNNSMVAVCQTTITSRIVDLHNSTNSFVKRLFAGHRTINQNLVFKRVNVTVRVKV